ncbi:hypothetical protein AK830_g9670 [Neonectria ditissima]|uniref:Uncharacterized protein n=1 Tax=Neonectria ditissima TaxID=78410 RepID=A0A0N8H5R3_9HYPO|nr:hypothetical protein AK830_g9670 [Neonectria ditissima]
MLARREPTVANGMMVEPCISCTLSLVPESKRRWDFEKYPREPIPSVHWLSTAPLVNSWDSPLSVRQPISSKIAQLSWQSIPRYRQAAMNRMFSSRMAFRAVAAGIGPAACAGSFLVNRRAIRCDSPGLAASSPPRRRRPSALDVAPETVNQVSSGSVAGFATGLVVALFSRTLALFSGLFAVSLHIAARYGWDVTRILGIRKLLEGSALWEKTKGKPWFTTSFLVTFILAAFVHL